jgi:hypothetical protein
LTKSPIGLHGQYALVPPLDFKSMMNTHWNEALEMPSSPALRSLWETMGKTFQRAIIDTINERETPWRVLQPPTGSGKTQGASVYAAMQAKLNKETEGRLKPVGLLLVTRLIAQAVALVTDINRLAGRNVAVAYHSQSKPSDIQAHDVLVITHQAYVNASEGLQGGRDGAWDRFLTWQGGRRLLTIIDEALANAIESNKVTVENISFVLGCIPMELRQAQGEEIRTLEALKDVLLHHASNGGEDQQEPNVARLLWRDAPLRLADASTFATNLSPLREAMRAVPYDTLIGAASEGQRGRIASRVDELLQDAQAILTRWAYYAQNGKEHSFNSSAFLIPHGVPGPVVLDATATQNFLWDLLEDDAAIVPIASGARSYGNVTLHVTRARGVGKHSMKKHFPTRYPRLLEALEQELGSDRAVFMCVHKDNEHVAETYGTRFAKFAVGHWGAIDGRNDWKDFDAAVIFGLPYRDPIWATNTFFALQGVQDDEWLQAPRWKHYVDVRSVMRQRQLSVSIVQAIGRIRCRKVVNEHGESPEADIFIVLPADTTGDGILDDIKSEMPGLRIVPWDFEMDGEKVRRPRNGSAHTALITFMKHRLPGETAMSTIQRELGLKCHALRALKETLRDASHVTTQALRAVGVRYEVSGVGRGARSFLVKQQAA